MTMMPYDPLADNPSDPQLIRAIKFEDRLRRTLSSRFSGDALDHMTQKCLSNMELNRQRDNKIMQGVIPELIRARMAQ